MLSVPDQRIAIVGAGPCGLACARELEVVDLDAYARQLRTSNGESCTYDAL